MYLRLLLTILILFSLSGNRHANGEDTIAPLFRKIPVGTKSIMTVNLKQVRDSEVGEDLQRFATLFLTNLFGDEDAAKSTLRIVDQIDAIGGFLNRPADDVEGAELGFVIRGDFTADEILRDAGGGFEKMQKRPGLTVYRATDATPVFGRELHMHWCIEKQGTLIGIFGESATLLKQVDGPFLSDDDILVHLAQPQSVKNTIAITSLCTGPFEPDTSSLQLILNADTQLDAHLIGQSKSLDSANRNVARFQDMRDKGVALIGAGLQADESSRILYQVLSSLAVSRKGREIDIQARCHRAWMNTFLYGGSCRYFSDKNVPVKTLHEARWVEFKWRDISSENVVFFDAQGRLTTGPKGYSIQKRIVYSDFPRITTLYDPQMNSLNCARITNVSRGSISAEAGLQAGDLVVSVNGKRIQFGKQLYGIENDKEKEKNRFEVLRGERVLKIEIPRGKLGITAADAFLSGAQAD